MSTITESATWASTVYQIDTTDAVVGGAGGIANLAAAALANRTQYLLSQVNGIINGTIGLSGWATLNSPAFTGTPTAPTPAAGDNSTKIATTAFAQTLVRGYVAVSVAGGVNVTLSQAQYSLPLINLTGALTANIAVILPSASGAWVIKNSTTGAFTVTVKTAAGTGVVVAQGASNALWGDGTNIYAEQTDFAIPFASPALTGTPTAPTAASGTNTTQLATTAFVQAALAAGAPGAFSTLSSTATARLGSPNFGSTSFYGSAVSVPTATWVNLPLSEGGANTLVGGNAYRIRLSTYGTGTVTGAAYLVYQSAAGTWTAKLIANNGTDANKPRIQVASGGVQVAHNHAATYSFSYTVETINTGNVNVGDVQLFGSDGVLTYDGDTGILSYLGTLNATTATKLATARNVVISGDMTGTASFDGSGDISIAGTLASSGVVAGTYRSVTVDVKGRVTAGTNPTTLAGYGITDAAPAASPALTGTPTAPTAAVNTNTTQLATTAFVLGQAATATPLINGSAAVGVATRFAREDHVHPTDTTRAPLASPALTGTPTAPTPTAGDNSTNIATTSFVQGLMGQNNTFTKAQRGSVVALTDAATVAVDLSLGNNFAFTIAGNRTLGTPTNAVPGQSGIIAVTQDATGSRTLAYGANWKFSGGSAPALSTTASAVDYLAYYVETATRILISMVKDVR